MSETPTLLFGKYKLLELIARGGMAEVFKAKSYGADGFEKIVVIKRILPELAQNQQFVEMAIDEAKLSVSLSHANIVQVFDLGREEDTYFIVMEYVHGMDFSGALRRCRKRGQAPPPELCVYICGETARALDYAHRRRDAQLRPLNIVHRDVSPQNVLLSFEGEVKVADFGIAKARTSIEEAGTIKGKYAYMSPEQAKGEPVDARADVFALGVVLYEALVGKNPYQERTAYETLRRVQSGTKVPIEVLWPECPDELARIIAKATHPERDERYASAAKLYEDLAGYLYTSRKRVTAHHLADWLESLREEPAADADAGRVRDALEDGGHSSVRTPVEIPVGGLSRPGPSTNSGRARANLERRDATVLAVEFPVDRHAMVETIEAIVHRHGGVDLASEDHYRAWMFSVSSTGGRDTEAAARAALKSLQTMQREGPSEAVGLGLHAARFHVRVDGTPEPDQWLTGALAIVRDLSLAAKGCILASEPVRRILGETFAVEPVEERMAGLERVPGTALVLLGERGAHEGDRRKFVGRKEPFRVVGDVFARAAKKGGLSLVVSGDAGSGKTRFLDEVHYRLRRMNHPVSWYSTRCLPSDREVPGAGISGILRTILGIDESDPESEIRERASRLRELGLHPDELAAAFRAIGLRALSEPSPGKAVPLRNALLRVAAGLARDQLTVLCWDNAENMDDESQQLVDELVRNAGRARLLVVIACRSGFVYPWKDAGSVVEIALHSLSDEESRALIALRLQIDERALPSDMLDDVLSKSTGNPLFIEEHLRSLQDAGAIDVADGVVIYNRAVADVEVPKTLRGLVTAELQRLTAPQRAILQVASVLGARWHLALLRQSLRQTEYSVESIVASLIERGALVADGDEHSFAHELRREVVYESIPFETRRELHATVAAVCEQIYADRLDDMAERLALHYRECNDRGKAVHYLERAAQRRVSERAFAAAAVLFARAVELAQSAARPDTARILSLYEQLGESALESAHVPSIERLRLGLAYAEELGDLEVSLSLMVQLGRLLFLVNRFGEALGYLERARTFATTIGKPSALFEIVSAIGHVYARNGEFGRARAVLAESVTLVQDEGNPRSLCAALLALARSEGSSGDAEKAYATLEQAREVAARAGAPELIVDALKTAALIAYHQRDFALAGLRSEEALEAAREYHLPYDIAVNSHNVGDAAMRLGDYRKAYTNLRLSQDVSVEHGYLKLLHVNDTVLAFVDAIGFGSEEGRARIESALEFAQQNGYKWDALHAHFLLGVLAQDRGDVERARQDLRDALALAQELNNHLYIEDCQRLLREVASLPPPPPASLRSGK
ncbi:MAG: protein kinase [Deltaproteobacteria bacterium]|nr:protein kinase [Deltaproteobacteria bacterium]